MKRIWLRSLIIFILIFLAFIIDLPSQVPIKFNAGPLKIDQKFSRPTIDISLGRFSFKRSLDLVLGLDLAGGSHLVFEADTSKVSAEKKKTAVNGLREVIERRVNLFGVSEPNVQTSSFLGQDRVIVELPGVKDTKEAIDLIGTTAQLIFAEVPESAESTGLNLTDLTGADLTDSNVIFDRTNGKPVVEIKFTKEGGEKFSKITQNNIGKRLAMVLDNNVISAPLVKEKISEGTAVISGEFSLEEAKKLAIQLNAGSLPVPIKLISERTVGATLGALSIEKSVRAGIVGVSMVLLFMILAYKKLGLVADIGLIIFGVITLALYKLFPVVLTLPGIAGFFLSVGMAVDSNILIFERLKEEKLKHPIQDAMEISFGRAWDSIRDANIATLVTAFILANPFDWTFLHTSGPVRGFAITLALGIGISLFTGIVVSRHLLRLSIRKE